MTRETVGPLEPWQEVDWTSHGPYGAATALKQPQPCGICHKPAWLLSPRKQTAMHKTCAGEYQVALLLLPILAALGHTPES